MNYEQSMSLINFLDKRMHPLMWYLWPNVTWAKLKRWAIFLGYGKSVTRLKGYIFTIPQVCPFCLLNESLGYTDQGILGCRLCQEGVDAYMEANYLVKEQIEWVVH